MTHSYSHLGSEPHPGKFHALEQELIKLEQLLLDTFGELPEASRHAQYPEVKKLAAVEQELSQLRNLLGHLTEEQKVSCIRTLAIAVAAFRANRASTVSLRSTTGHHCCQSCALNSYL